MIDRDEVAWYYRAGGSTHGPVTWPRIEELAREDANLQIGMRAPSEWRTVESVLATHPELEEGADLEAIAEEKRRASREPLSPCDGFAHWLGEAYIIVDSELWSFVAAGVGGFALAVLSLGSCAPAVHAGLVRMALNRYRRDRVTARTLLEGFDHFREAGICWGVCLGSVLVIAGIPALIYLLMVGHLTGPRPATVQAGLWAWFVLVFLFVSTAAFFAMALIVDRDMKALDAIRASMRVVDGIALRLFIIQTLLTMMCGASFLIFFVGGLVNLPLMPAGHVAAYMWFFRGGVEAAARSDNSEWSENDACTAEG